MHRPGRRAIGEQFHIPQDVGVGHRPTECKVPRTGPAHGDRHKVLLGSRINHGRGRV